MAQPARASSGFLFCPGYGESGSGRGFFSPGGVRARAGEARLSPGAGSAEEALQGGGEEVTLTIEGSLAALRRWLGVIDWLLALGVGVAVSWSRYGSLEGWARLGFPHPPGPGGALLAFAFLWVACLWAAGSYSRHRFLGRREEARRICVAALFLLGVMAGFLYFTHNQAVSRALPPLLALGLGAATLAGRGGGRWLLARLRRRGYNRCRVLIVGTGEGALEFARQVMARPELGVEVAGFLDGERKHILGLPVLGRMEEIRKVLSEQVVDEVILAHPGVGRELVAEVISACAEEGKAVHVAAEALPLGRSGFGRPLAGEVAGLPVLTYMRGPRESAALFMKRMMDLLGAALGLLLFAPFMFLIALAIKLDSPGPVFFVQERVGLHGRRFRMYKFRSMVADAERRLAEVAHLNEMTGPVFKTARDPRVTRVGRVLRRLSLDELPQLFNVLKGEMSLVGPRPPLPREVAKYGPRERRRLSVKPGITCLWQVSGRNKIPFERWVELDLEYVERWSLWLDLKILARTVPAVLGLTGI